MHDYVAAIDARVRDRHLLTHPFYAAWTRGELTRAALADYARQYYRHVAAFPTYLSAVHANCDDPLVRRQILANLVDEEAGSPNHPELWLQFAESVGVPAEEARTTAPWAETRALIDTFRSICRESSPAEGLAALYAYESQIPAVSESKIAGLREHYGFADDDAGYRYFHVHIEADREHAATERALLEAQLGDDNGPTACAAAERVLGALWEMLSGVCRRHDIACA